MDFELEDPLTRQIIGAAISVHRELGPGLLESVYQECMCIELDHLGLTYERESQLSIVYRSRELRAKHRLDLLVGGLVIVELKAVEALHKVHQAQLLTQMRLAKKRVGLLINFNVEILRDGGIKRLVLSE